MARNFRWNRSVRALAKGDAQMIPSKNPSFDKSLKHLICGCIPRKTTDRHASMGARLSLVTRHIRQDRHRYRLTINAGS